jgi:hypothetical protein
MHHIRRHLLIGALASTLPFASIADACTPPDKPPKLSAQFASVENVYMARLLTYRRSPLPDPNGKRMYPHYWAEDATFRVLLTLKGAAQKTGVLRIHTAVSNGNCFISVQFPGAPPDDRDNGAPTFRSDVWILFVNGKQPYELDSSYPSKPINYFSESDLRLLLGPPIKGSTK